MGAFVEVENLVDPRQGTSTVSPGESHSGYLPSAVVATRTNLLPQGTTNIWFVRPNFLPLTYTTPSPGNSTVR